MGLFNLFSFRAAQQRLLVPVHKYMCAVQLDN